MRGRGRDNNNHNNNSIISSRQVVPYEDEDGDLDEEAGPDPAMLAWIAASNRGRGRGSSGGGGSGSGGSDISVRGSSRSLGRGMSGSHHRFGHHRERSAKFRRVKPLPLEESEDARERGVPVPAVGLPESIQRTMDAEAAAYATMYSSNNSGINTPNTSTTTIATTTTPNNNNNNDDDDDDNDNVSVEDDGPSLSTAKKSYIAAQLKQLAQVVSFSSSTSANSNSNNNSSARGSAFSPSHLLPSPATAGSIGSNNRTAAPSPAAFSPAHHGRSTDGSPLGRTSPLGFHFGEQQQLRSSRNPLHPSRPPRGGAGNLGVGPAAVAGVAQGPGATSPPPPAAAARARPLFAGAAAETEASTSSIASFLVAQLDGLSQLLLDEEESAAPNAAATTVSSPTLSSSGGAATNRRGSGGSGGSRGSGAGPHNGANPDGSLKYSLSAASSSSLLSRLSSLFDLDEEEEEGLQSARPPPTMLNTDAGNNSRNNNGHDENYGRNGDNAGAGGAGGADGVGGVGGGVGGVGVGGGGGGQNFVIGIPGESKSSSRAPFHGSGDGGGGGGGGHRTTARETIPGGQQQQQQPAALPLTGERRHSGERKKRSLSPPAAASGVDAHSSLRLPGRPKPSPFSGDLVSPPISEDDSKWDDEEAGKARVEVESDGTARRRRGSRDTAAVGTEAFGRARLWRQMLEMESRAGSMLGNIVAENAGALDQGLILPCAPNDEEKVIYHKTGKGFLITMGVLSLAALSAGMWLFALAAPYFYWFGVPTTFLMGYLLLSYFGVAVWGKNFDPKEHEKTLRKARENRYYPSVDVFLPVCCEPTHLLDNTWKHVAALDYPNVTVHVLDDGAKEEVRQLARLHGFNYIRRDNRPELKKAGNLRYAFNRTRAEIIVIFDADFCPRPEFLRETTPYFAEEDVAILQTPQFFRCREEQTWVERGAGVTQELFYRMVQVNRDKFDAAICVGTCGVYRRAALAPFGGTAAIGYSEDVHTGFNCTQLGYKVKYIPQVMAMGTCPDEPRAFFMQQYRWCMGSTTLLCNKDFWRSNLTRMQKLCYISGMFYYSATAMAIFTGPMPGMLLIWFKPSSVLWFNISFAVPSIFFSVIVMRIWAKQKFDFSCQRVKVIQSFSHLYAIKDRIMKTAIPWVPTGGGASSRSSSQAYDSSVKLMLCWTTATTLLTIGGAAWRIGEFPWYHFLPTIVLTTFNLALHLSTLL